ncbi:MAG TPA: NAD(P)H-hydrate dehydratase, partial [Miltoncostaea sp.]|nr:NAD(P)H-hydrate dehydratase [Miltoncostaea sp.]
MAVAQPSTPPPIHGCTPLFDAEGMRDADRRATSIHVIPSIVLMERAGLAAAQAILEGWPAAHAATILVGRGNNGGDGLVVARHLLEAGWTVRVLAPGGEPPRTPDAQTMTTIASTIGIRVEAFTAAEPHAAGAVAVDALLGTGATGAPRDDIAGAVTWLRAHPGPVVALDVPTGVESDTGRVPGDAVRADLTVTFHGDMPGLRVEPGRGHAGRVVVADIGIPAAVRLAPAAWLAGHAAGGAIPRKGTDAEKYGAGAVLVIGGATGLTGAPALAARATLRAGAGLTVVGAPAAVQPLIAGELLEVMVAPLPDGGAGHLTAPGAGEALAQASRVGAVALGPGLGRADGTGEAVAALLAGLEKPLVLDADGLWHLHDAPERLRERPAPTVITPHAGEAARLLGVERAAVEGDRLASARELAERSGAVVVLKGAGTVVAAPGATPVVAEHGTSALATAGTGDVLTGVVAACLAKGMAPHAAAVAAVALHALAGELAGRGDGTIASDVIEALPAARDASA